jgi:Icc-related predicted phosphoesterase
MASRTIVVGDIHGCYDELMELLDKVGFERSDRVVSVGDLITKGPKSREVLELFMF